MNHISGTKIRHTVLFIIFFSTGFSLGWVFHKQKAVIIPTSIRENSSDYKFIHPFLFLQVPEDESTPEFQSLKNTVSKYVSNTISKNNATDVSVYFRELESNRWIGINADDKYAPASMLKVASLIAFFRAYQDNPDLISREITLGTGNIADNEQAYYPPAHKLKSGEVYTVKDLLSYMIIESDNNALDAINFVTGEKILNKTYTELRIPIPTNNQDAVDDFFTAKMISRLFRTLYNGTYISQALSEKALNLLTQTNFKEGLVAGVPQGTTVAHKFGERTLNIVNPDLPSSNRTIRELHDCGIVYEPNNPYFICVMTKGQDFPSLQKIIVDISNTIWKETQSFKKNTVVQAQ